MKKRLLIFFITSAFWANIKASPYMDTQVHVGTGTPITESSKTDKVLLFANSTQRSQTLQQMSSEAMLKVEQFSKALQSVLLNGIKEGGFERGIQVCNLQAPPISNSFADENWQVRRTSLKFRNPENQPDNWERKVLLSLELQKQAGAPISTLQHSEVVALEDGMYFRFMKAIPTNNKCLACHGEKISTSVSEIIGKYYPADMATGFKFGSIRGAFSLKKKL